MQGLAGIAGSGFVLLLAGEATLRGRQGEQPIETDRAPAGDAEAVGVPPHALLRSLERQQRAGVVHQLRALKALAG